MELVRLRYVGDDRIRVPKLGRVVEPDELVTVPADLLERYAWPETTWRREDNETQTPPPPVVAAKSTVKGGGRDA